jgi:ornithine cyclodeaminase
LTIFDGTGVGTQDIAVANAVLAMARESGVAQWVEI